MWVQLRTQKQIKVRGVPTVFQAGDWVEVGRQTAQQWIARGEAIIPQNSRAEILPGDAGLTLTGYANAVQKLGEHADLLPVEQGPLQLPLLWRYTLIWDGKVNLHPGLVISGLHLLDRWQLAVPIDSYQRLAEHATGEDRALTEAVLPDLRVPVYASGCLFVRTCEETEALLQAWLDEPGDDRDLAFLRVLYQRPLLVLALPASWHRGG